MKLRTQKYHVILYYDLKTTLRTTRLLISISILIPVFFCYVLNFLLPGENKSIASYWFLLFGLESLFTNLFFRDRYEFRFYSIMPMSYRSLIIMKNINSFLIVLLLVVSSWTILFIFNQITTGSCIELMYFLIPAILALLATGNVISLFSRKRTRHRFQYLFLFFHSLSIAISSAVYFWTYRQHNFVLYACFVAVILGVYLVSIQKSAKLLLKYKYKLLEMG